jgi:hypothetical protein
MVMSQREKDEKIVWRISVPRETIFIGNQQKLLTNYENCRKIQNI